MLLDPHTNGIPRSSREQLFALTSLAPGAERVPRTRECLRSWRAAGLQVRSFNHPDEITQLAALYDAEFVPVAETTIETFGRHFVPIHALLDWAAERDVPALVINSDIYLRTDARELDRVRRLSAGGLCYIVRHNYTGTLATAEPEPDGIDGFLFQGRDGAKFPRSIMSMGQPFWDYWLPPAFAERGAPLYSVEFPMAFHQNHPRAWSDGAWHRCALDFLRITGRPCADPSFEGCCAMGWHLRRQFDGKTVRIPKHPISIRDWVHRTFRGSAPKVMLELGAHNGEDTDWLARVPNATVHAFEPDPRNHPPARRNVVLHRAAIADRDGTGALVLSERGWGRPWTASSSIKRPKNHLARYDVTFGETIEVELVALDTFSRRHASGAIDFIWADVQGAEGEMIRGGRETLARTRYLYTEYSDDELYEGQVALDDILRLLPDFRVLELWPSDVLLANRRFERHHDGA